MKKMKTLFKKGANHEVIDELQCSWVFDDGVTAHIKLDGTACAVIGGKLYKRYDAKRNKKTGLYKSPPAGAIECCEPDEITGHWPHWVPVAKEDKWHLEAMNGDLCDGTYELCGPKVNGNREGFSSHKLVSHNSGEVDIPSIKFDDLKLFLRDLRNEGLVFHHPDGRMCKIRRKDFGFDWPIKLKKGDDND